MPVFLNKKMARSRAMPTATKPSQFKYRTDVRLMTSPPNPDPLAKPNWMNEVFTLKAMSGSAFEVGHISKSTLSHHIKILREAGVIQPRIEGKQHYFSYVLLVGTQINAKKALPA